MKLLAYLAQEKIKPREFAERVGISQPFMSRLLHGQRRPGGQLAMKIEEATGGNVTLRDFYTSNDIAENAAA
jgi:transcriptional regulator with XRE-family HTH domain